LNPRSPFLDSIRARAALRRRRIVFPEGEDRRTIVASIRLESEGLVDPVLLGRPEVILALLAGEGVDPQGFEIVDPADETRRQETAASLLSIRAHKGLSEKEAWEHAVSPLMLGALLVRQGVVSGSVAGAAHPTGDVLRAAFWCVGPEPGIRTVSSSFYMEVAPFRSDGREVLTFTDCAVVPEPDPGQLAEIALAAARARSQIVGDDPRVAFLSYSTRGSAEGEAVDRVREALKRFREISDGIPAEGEIQVDAALLAEVARRKAPDSVVAGRANVLVFPDLNAGNIAYKLVQRLAGAEAVGPILQGLARPCNDLSRGASAEDIVSVACITALTATA
jgi:phosphate acetyltransferase